jgi:hypothetical protein
MTNDSQHNPQYPEIPGTESLGLADVTGLYVELANRVSEHTRVSTEELTKIIASIHQANKAY